MGENFLKGEVLISVNGKDYRTPGMVDKTRAERYFSKIGFTVLEISQLYRHLHGKFRNIDKCFSLSLRPHPVNGAA